MLFFRIVRVEVDLLQCREPGESDDSAIYLPRLLVIVLIEARGPEPWDGRDAVSGRI